MNEDTDFRWRQRAARSWDISMSVKQTPGEARPLSIFRGSLSIVPRVVCALRDHHRGILSIEDGRIIEIRGTILTLRCRFCGHVSAGWQLAPKGRTR
jgi:hypothetical protein